MLKKLKKDIPVLILCEEKIEQDFKDVQMFQTRTSKSLSHCFVSFEKLDLNTSNKEKKMEENITGWIQNL